MTDVEKARFLAEHYQNEADNVRRTGFGGPEFLESKLLHAKAFRLYADMADAIYATNEELDEKLENL
jgi:hypothetical protein